MATKKLSKCGFVERGYGQVEPNHLSGIRTGQVYAQLPAASDIEVLENGQFAKYDYKNGEVNFTGENCEWMLVFNEVKICDEREVENDFAMVKDNYDARIYNAVGTAMKTDTTMVPRLVATHVGDIFTTNTVKDETLTEGAILRVGADGYLSTAGTSAMRWQVVKIYTLADRNKAVKLVRITDEGV